MEILSYLKNLIVSDPLKVFYYAFGPAGGLIYGIYRLFRNRARIHIKIKEAGLSGYSQKKPTDTYRILFEVENRGPKPNSLEQTIKLKAYSLPATIIKSPVDRLKLKRDTYLYNIELKDRSLPINAPKEIIANGKKILPNDNFFFLHLITYEFKPTGGRTRCIRIRNSFNKKPLSFIGYIYRYIYYISTGNIYKLDTEIKSS